MDAQICSRARKSGPLLNRDPVAGLDVLPRPKHLIPRVRARLHTPLLLRERVQIEPWERDTITVAELKFAQVLALHLGCALEREAERLHRVILYGVAIAPPGHERFHVDAVDAIVHNLDDVHAALGWFARCR